MAEERGERSAAGDKPAARGRVPGYRRWPSDGNEIGAIQRFFLRFLLKVSNLATVPGNDVRCRTNAIGIGKWSLRKLDGGYLRIFEDIFEYMKVSRVLGAPRGCGGRSRMLLVRLFCPFLARSSFGLPMPVPSFCVDDGC